MQTTLSIYATLAGNLARSLETTAAKPQVARDVAQPLAAGVGADLLATLQNLKLGGP